MTKKRTVAVLLLVIMLLTTFPATQAAEDIVYTHSTLKFSLTLPATWKELYKVYESDNRVNFISINNEAYGGFLFNIYVFDEELEEIYPGAWEIMRIDGMYVYAGVPTDIPYDYENPALTSEYKRMEQDVPAILDTFRFNTHILTAKPTSSAVLVNGNSVSFDAYNINDNNYFKLRDLAYILSGTESQFEITWDEAKNAIILTIGKPYTPVEGEMSAKGSASKTPIAASAKIHLDGKEVNLTAYNIDGNNYFKLRDIGSVLDFGVIWDDINNKISVDTAIAYTD